MASFDPVLPDLHGKIALVTGANAGLGRATAEALAAAGASVGLLCRDLARGEATRDEINAATGEERAWLLHADLANGSSLRAAAAALEARAPRLDILVNNAGVMLVERQLTPAGLEASFAINHLGPFLLTHLLLPALRRAPAGRVVNVASEAHRFHNLDLDDLEARRPYKSMRTYGASKLCNLLFNQELARRLQGSGVTTNAAHPGGVRTELGDSQSPILAKLGAALKRFMRSPEVGARTQLWLATAPELEGQSGGYYADGKPIKPSSAARDEALAARLWQLSERLTGVEGTALALPPQPQR